MYFSLSGARGRPNTDKSLMYTYCWSFNYFRKTFPASFQKSNEMIIIGLTVFTLVIIIYNKNTIIYNNKIIMV